jgi:hypothetical protein
MNHSKTRQNRKNAGTVGKITLPRVLRTGTFVGVNRQALYCGGSGSSGGKWMQQ